ncbi:CHAD domain-containing protein [Actinoplanes aureus]|uniref:CHAD domain-containing protein n=1 Tax=Actinoplanes aureus TaxID=2792083 RepID=A0A931CGY3_9ACTN|nr:CHAD domain-containing protein [Actinoplanes aureus]MBG0567068.1 CHAD domain-containing protein [Actinoplanes aureus]
MRRSSFPPYLVVGQGQLLGFPEADESPLTVEALAAALTDDFAIEFGPPSVVHGADLDTFDRRLGAAGFSLHHLSDPAGQQLVLIPPGAHAPLTMPVTNAHWPALVTALPAGAVRDELAPLVTIRALMVLDERDHRIRHGELRNEDQKILARLQLIEQAADAPAWLSVNPLRGYGGDTRRAVRLLTAAGFPPIRPVQVALTRNDTGVRQVRIERSAPAITLLVAAWSEHLAVMRANLPGVLDDVDTEFLHDFRVALRRTRSILKLGRAALPKDVSDRWEPDLKWLGDLTTPVRDLDVYELGLPEMAGWLKAAGPADLQTFAVQLRRHRSAARRTLVRGLRSARFRNVLSGWADVLADLAGPPPGQASGLTVGELANRSIGRAYRRVVRGGADIDQGTPAEALHSLRKRCKELRYALELFAPISDRAARKRVVADLKDLQDVLGRFQDADVQKQTLYRFAEQMREAHAPTKALLAMGELVSHLDADQQRARGEFDRAFARFSRPAGRTRIRLLRVGR